MSGGPNESGPVWFSDYLEAAWRNRPDITVGVDASSTFRMQLSSSAKPDVLHVSGEPLLEGTKEALKNLDLPHLVPAGSKARILRDAVLTCSANQSTADYSPTF